MFLNIKEVSQLTSLSESTIRRIILVGDFPKPVHLHGRKRVWSEVAVRSWLHQRIGGLEEKGTA